MCIHTSRYLIRVANSWISTHYLGSPRLPGRGSTPAKGLSMSCIIPVVWVLPLSDPGAKTTATAATQATTEVLGPEIDPWNFAKDETQTLLPLQAYGHALCGGSPFKRCSHHVHQFNQYYGLTPTKQCQILKSQERRNIGKLGSSWHHCFTNLGQLNGTSQHGLVVDHHFPHETVYFGVSNS